jgi:hypothetical protein
VTLILNEIHVQNGLNETLLVAAADRRVSNPDGSYNSLQRKLFTVPYHNATISYFGIAEVFPSGKREYLSEWLPKYITRQAASSDLKSFAETLRTELHNVLPQGVLQQSPSGFHLCGYNKSGLPEFWSLTNVGGLQGYSHVNFKPQYGSPSEDFLRRDAVEQLGWDRENPASAENKIMIYRNGDFRAHVAVWETLDDAMSKLFQFSDFERPKTPSDYGRYVKFKFEFISYIYKNWTKKNIIARPIDVIVSNSSGIIFDSSREREKAGGRS